MRFSNEPNPNTSSRIGPNWHINQPFFSNRVILVFILIVIENELELFFHFILVKLKYFWRKKSGWTPMGVANKSINQSIKFKKSFKLIFFPIQHLVYRIFVFSRIKSNEIKYFHLN